MIFIYHIVHFNACMWVSLGLNKYCAKFFTNQTHFVLQLTMAFIKLQQLENMDKKLEQVQHHEQMDNHPYLNKHQFA